MIKRDFFKGFIYFNLEENDLKLKKIPDFNII